MPPFFKINELDVAACIGKIIPFMVDRVAGVLRHQSKSVPIHSPKFGCISNLGGLSNLYLPTFCKKLIQWSEYGLTARQVTAHHKPHQAIINAASLKTGCIASNNCSAITCCTTF
jgi:hypothetical protein